MGKERMMRSCMVSWLLLVGACSGGGDATAEQEGNLTDVAIGQAREDYAAAKESDVKTVPLHWVTDGGAGIDRKWFSDRPALRASAQHWSVQGRTYVNLLLASESAPEEVELYIYESEFFRWEQRAHSLAASAVRRHGKLDWDTVPVKPEARHAKK